MRSGTSGVLRSPRAGGVAAAPVTKYDDSRYHGTMLTLRQDQLDQLRNARHEAGYERLRAQLREPYTACTAGESTAERFDDWFERRLADCRRWGIRRPVHVQSLLWYCIAHWPGFPEAPPYAACLRALEDDGLDEADKTDRVNHRLLFVR